MSMKNLFGPSQGARAVRSGAFGELALEAAFQAYGINIANDNPEFHHDTDIFGRKDKLLIRQYQINKDYRVDYLRSESADKRSWSSHFQRSSLLATRCRRID